MRSIAASCSDDRMELARRGALSPSDLSDFTTHLSTCADCRIAWRLSADFEGSAGPVPGDELLVSRAAKAALASTAPRARGGLVRVAFVVAAIFLVAGVARGAIALHARYSASAGAAGAGGAESVSKRRGRRIHASTSTREAEGSPDRLVIPDPKPKPEPSPPALQTIQTESVETSAAPVSGDRSERTPSRAAGRATRPLALASVSPAVAAVQPPPFQSLQPPIWARLMFERAVSARHEGRLREAIDAFRELQSHFPGSPEALVSLVSLGELLLSTGAAAEALASFGDYEGRAPAGALVPEALAGEARALARLGRAQESEATWRQLARRFPESPYAYRAPKMDVDRATP